nr:winged helix DNA-binding protein [Methylomarinum sp. Ch1-1]MDP4521319.1 winged helix DNA-binding protein [Methylomarinum sp. Ch1-1]
MKYSTHINLSGIDHYRLSDCTDLDDWLILDYIHDWSRSRSLGVCRRGDYVWLNFKTALDQMPILRVKEKSGISKRIKKLTALGLIVTHQDDEDKRLFVKLTELFFKVMGYRKDEKRVLT